MVKTAAIVVAGGRGTRARQGGDAPKQYRTVSGIPVIRRAISAFNGHQAIGPILPVIHEDDRGLFEEATASLRKHIQEPVGGGATRQQSVFAGLEALADDPPDAVLIHDAARPFVSGGVIDAVLAALESSPGAIPALPVADTLKRAEDDRIAETVDRSNLWIAQTPQGFRFPEIFAAHSAAMQSGKHDFTDDASIAEWHGLEVALVPGERRNVKLTTQEDFEMAELAMAEDLRVGQGYDVHAFAPGDHVMLCGIAIPHDQSLAGHSDADVALHALTDALLGAIGDGDIGHHFPPSDPQWKGCSSDVFLRDAVDRVRARGGRLVNVDVTLICERPKVGPHRLAMREALARLLEVDIDRVGVKATTTEGLGFTGRGEGIASMATATVALARRGVAD